MRSIVFCRVLVELDERPFKTLDRSYTNRERVRVMRCRPPGGSLFKFRFDVGSEKEPHQRRSKICIGRVRIEKEESRVDVFIKFVAHVRTRRVILL